MRDGEERQKDGINLPAQVQPLWLIEALDDLQASFDALVHCSS